MTETSSANPDSTVPSPIVPFWGQISFLWLLLVPVVCAIYTLLLPIAPNDFWYNVRAGAFITQTGHIPTTALFTTSLPPGTPYYNQSWLAQVLLFKTLQLGGLSGIILLRTFCLTAAFVFLAFTAWRRVLRINQGARHPLSLSTLARVVALSALLSYVQAASNMDIRPQTFSVLLCALFIFCIFEWPFLKTRCQKAVILFLAVCMILWANLHGAFIVGLILLASLLLGEIGQSVLAMRGGNSIPLFGTVSPSSLFFAKLLFAIAFVATLLNPRGWELYGYVFKLAGDKASQKFIQEWQSPNFSQWYGALFFCLLALSLILAGVLWRRLRTEGNSRHGPPAARPEFGLRLSEIFIFAATAIMALRDIRSIIWFALCLAPILAALSTRLLLTGKPSTIESIAVPVPRAAQYANAVIALILLASVLPFLPQLRSALPLPPEYSSNFAPTPRGAFPYGFSGDPPSLLERNTPVEAVEYLRKNPPRGRVWTDMVFGSYLTWAGFPKILPHADPRVEMFPFEFWEEYGRLQNGPEGAAQTLKSQNFTAALLHKKDGRGLIRQLRKSGWRVVSQRRDAVLLLAPRDVA